MKIALAQINPIIGDLAYNAKKIIGRIEEARTLNAKIVIFPELALTGYPPEDLLFLPSFVDSVLSTLEDIIQASQDIAVIVGCVRRNPHHKEKPLFNSAAIIENTKLIGFQDKTLLPDYDIFSERRYFEPGTQAGAWTVAGCKVGITICEDIWQHAGAVEYVNYRHDPVDALLAESPSLVFNLSASPYHLLRLQTR